GLNHLTLPLAILDLQIDDPQYQRSGGDPLPAKGRITGYRIGRHQSAGVAGISEKSILALDVPPTPPNKQLATQLARLLFANMRHCSLTQSPRRHSPATSVAR